jgi:hypothetical protein
MRIKLTWIFEDWLWLDQLWIVSSGSDDLSQRWIESPSCLHYAVHTIPPVGATAAAADLSVRHPLINIDALPGCWLLHLNPPVSSTPLATSLPENEQNKLQTLDGTSGCS